MILIISNVESYTPSQGFIPDLEQSMQTDEDGTINYAE